MTRMWERFTERDPDLAILDEECPESGETTCKMDFGSHVQQGETENDKRLEKFYRSQGKVEFMTKTCGECGMTSEFYPVGWRFCPKCGWQLPGWKSQQRLDRELKEADELKNKPYKLTGKGWGE